MKTLAQWFALATVALSMAASGGDAERPPTAMADQTMHAETSAEPEVHRISWPAWLWGLLRQEQMTPSPGGSAPPEPPEPPDPPDPPDPPEPPAPPATLGPVETKEEEQARFFAAVGRQLLAPGYASFAAAAQTLATAAETHCDAADGEAEALEDAWRQAMAAWQRVQHLRTGPVEEDHRRLRIQLFPDNSNAVERNLEALLSGTEAITETLVQSSPVGAQGLPALERLIFSDAALAADSRRCQAALAIARNLRTMAGDIAAPWQEGGVMIEAFVNGAEPFFDRDDVLVSILESIAVQAEFIADRKIAPALRGGSTDSLESPLAKHSKENLSANADALANLIDNAHGGVYRLRDYLLRVHDEKQVGDQLATVAVRAQGKLAALTASFEDILAGRASGDLEGIRVDFNTLSDLGLDAAVAAGVNLGFNSEDGD